MIIWYPNHPTLVYWGLRGWWCWIMFGIIGKYIQKRFRRKIKCCEANVLNSNILISESMIPKHEALLHRASDLDSIFSLNDLSLKISSWFFLAMKNMLKYHCRIRSFVLTFYFCCFLVLKMSLFLGKFAKHYLLSTIKYIFEWHYQMTDSIAEFNQWAPNLPHAILEVMLFNLPSPWYIASCWRPKMFILCI